MDRKKYRVDTSMIYFLKFILEAYEGIAQMTTLDSRKGVIEIYSAPGCVEDVERILTDLKAQMRIEALTIPGKITDTDET